MAKLKDRKLAASTLIEVLIAMVIIVAVFGMAMGIYTNVTQSGYSISTTQSQQQMQTIIGESISNRDWQDQEVIEDSIRYRKTVSAWPGYDDLVLIEVRANQNGKEMGRLRQVVRREVKDE
ncbi:hypothetical protein BDE36_2602 [Arcticibacter tournemirensis]|uniref:Type II secretion system protein n=1 Tax=Arcticibacter tournemirensis TaxID=699437 RepID=A0A5M9GN95_9SPHI|nr:hypothetical protein [Arcticibacter tournemirensis]KAA8476142.1 hypothetical protein F1649_20350 [Arcticibacter tournemirensis]TQM50838.1 hypothetical protein BDE36_2602 [Arcticibacter tournemirensis]